jgi:hypothetical protein
MDKESQIEIGKNSRGFELFDAPHVEAVRRIGEWLRSDAGPSGECPYADCVENIHGHMHFIVLVQWWANSPPRWREIRDILRGMGATEITIKHTLYDEMNDEEDGRGPGGASLEVTFAAPDDGIDHEMRPYHLIPVAVDTNSGALMTAKEASDG